MPGRQQSVRPLAVRGVRPVRRDLVVTAEHGGNQVPEAYLPLFVDRADLLASHRGWDPGSAGLAAVLAETLAAPCSVAGVTRLLVDLNRSEHNPAVFSEVSRPLPPLEREGLLRAFHRPHRQQVEKHVAVCIEEGCSVLHLGLHSFTPVLSGQVRRADLALLYDPGRLAERTLAAAWVQGLRVRLPDLRILRNDPYRGTSDGLTTTLRKRFADPRYLGIEVEVNQRLLDADGRFPSRVADALLATLPKWEGWVAR